MTSIDIAVTVMSKIIVTSDQHLGYERSNVTEFKNFLDYISNKRSDVGALVLLGDFVDMWRRDVSGLFMIFSDIIERLLNLQNSNNIEIYIVAGNHDYHLLKLNSSDYKFHFHKFLPDDSSDMKIAGNSKYIFKHGWEFDFAQNPLIMEAMCHNLSDDSGHARSSVYNALQVGWDGFNNILKEVINFHNKEKGYVDNLMLPPEKRLEPYIGDVEKTAYASIHDDEVLIFGHTHRPFISTDHKLVNTGCWVNDAKLHNTFVEIDPRDQEIKLFQFMDERTIKDITAENSYPFNR